MKVRFVHLRKHIDKVASMPAPRKVEEIDEWLKAARRAISEIPDVKLPSNWKVGKKHATPQRVVFELNNGEDVHTKAYDFCHVVINRQASSLG